VTSDEQDRDWKISEQDPIRLVTRHSSLVTVLQLFSQAPLYAILDTAARPDLPAEAVLEALLRAGVRVIQYRHKDAFRRSHFEQCVTLARRTRQAGGAFLINDRADVADLCGAHGVHLGQEDLSPEAARRFLGDSPPIGYSTHNLDQARRAAALPVDYIAIGPVFPTATKKNPDPVVGLSLVSAVRAITNKPLVAIGGITMENAPAVLSAGADAVAVIGDLLAAPDIEERARQFLKALKKSEPRA
jgi:thiamine-phosphate pyrophosphorylase